MEDTASALGHYSAERYLELGDCGILAPDDRVELLDGIIVAMPPPTPLHENAVHRVLYLLLRRLGFNVVVRSQATFLVGSDSVPQPDIAVCPGNDQSYEHARPTRAHLLVEVSLSSIAQDRLTKSAIYARVPCYWIVNLRDLCVEVYREPDRFKSEYRSVTSATGADILTIDDFPGIRFEAAELLPPARGADEEGGQGEAN